MNKLQVEYLRDAIASFDFKRLFIEELGWSQVKGVQSIAIVQAGKTFAALPLAELSGVVVYTVVGLADMATRLKIQKEISLRSHENLVIFVDENDTKKATQSLWLWVKREGGKNYPREHLYVKGQPGDLFISKIAHIVVDMNELDNKGNFPLAALVNRMKDALDVERVTKRFFREFEGAHGDFIAGIGGIEEEKDRRWYASVLLHRLMFIWFLQKKHFLDGGNGDYLQTKLIQTKQQGENRYYAHFLKPLFFEGFAKPFLERSQHVRVLLGDIKYLNGGLFLPHGIEQKYTAIRVKDAVFEQLFDLFGRYSWNLNDTPGGQDDEINPDVLGYIFEKYINQKAFGAYYTRPEITDYLCERTIYALILEKINCAAVPELNLAARHFESVPDLLIKLDADLCRELLFTVLPKISLLDPACGSGAFLVAAMKTLINVYAAIVGKIKFLNDKALNEWLKKIETDHANINYFIKKTIITDNLFGVDMMAEATEIAKLRLFLALVASAQNVDQLEPLPNIDFNIMAGNSLIGLTKVNVDEYEKGTMADLFRKSYRQILDEKNRLIDQYRHGAEMYGEDLRILREHIEAHKAEAQKRLNDLLLAEFGKLNIQFEEATWDGAKNKEGKPKKRLLKIEDIEALQPFHWGYEFDDILNRRGGFDAIITNPPWEIFKPNAKEFFEDYSDLVTKKKMAIHDFEKAQADIIKDPDIKKAWLHYLSAYPHVSAFYRSAPQYANQISIVGGKKAGSDTNLYKLFTEQCFNLLRENGQCGIVIPSGIYTDLGTKSLRTMLFEKCQITGLFGIENRKTVFENVDSRFKFVVMTFAKGGQTEKFPAAFMRHHVAELAHFPAQGSIAISVDFVRRLSPDSLSVMEFKNDRDVAIAEKMLRFPLLGEDVEGKWKIALTSEFHMTGDSHLFKTAPAKGRLPLYEGKMIWHFDHRFAEPRYWVDEKEGRAAVLGRTPDEGQHLDYQQYRLGFRDIASNTNERTLVSSMIPPTFHGNKIPTVCVVDDTGKRLISETEQVFLCAVWNSFLVDFLVRMKITTTLNFFYIYQLPIPRLTASDKAFAPIVERAARLICTTPEFDDLAREVGLASHKDGASEPNERAQLRAELDGMIAHLYGLTEEEFTHILKTFPIVNEGVKTAALHAYQAPHEKGAAIWARYITPYTTTDF